MKFVNLLKTDSALYSIIEHNEFHLEMLASFLISDGYLDAVQFLEWLSELPITDEYFFFGSNSYYMEVEKDKVTIRPEWYGFIEDMIEDYEDWKFETTKNNMINILKQWVTIIGENPYEKNKKGNLPSRIALIKNRDEFIVESIEDTDPRFSRLIRNDRGPYAKIQKSQIFENYLTVEANDDAFFKIGMMLSKYNENKENILNWLMSKTLEYGTTLPSKTCSTGFSILYKENDIIYLNCKYNDETKKHDYDLPIIKVHNFLALLEQWQEILNKEQFPKEIIIQQENDRIFLKTQN